MKEILRLASSKQGRYIIIGSINTIVIYIISAAIYNALLPKFNFFFVGAIVNVVAISISFSTQKKFVFKSEGNWLKEYSKSYVVYGAAAVFSIGLMWALLTFGQLTIWLAQAIVTAVAIAISYAGHTTFTFKSKENTPGDV
jgi:putative flippase GtrA